MAFDATPTSDPKAKALDAHRRLCREYRCPIAYFHDHDPLSELVSALLSHRTRNRDSHRAFQALRAAYPTWEAMRDAPTAEVEALIPMVTWPEQKAPRVQAVLRGVTARAGALDLGFLGDLPVEDARAWLEALPGVGPKTSAAVLSFSDCAAPLSPWTATTTGWRSGWVSSADDARRSVPRGARRAHARGLGTHRRSTTTTRS
jgi:endonuclease-3